MKKIHLLAFTLLLLQASPAIAGDGCEEPRNGYDATYCKSKLFMESDKELNSVYQELKTSLNAEQKTRLTQAQRNWIDFRDSECSRSKGGAYTINVDCNYKVNRRRSEFLRDRLLECKTGHCRNDLLFSENFASDSRP